MYLYLVKAEKHSGKGNWPSDTPYVEYTLVEAGNPFAACMVARDEVADDEYPMRYYVKELSLYQGVLLASGNPGRAVVDQEGIAAWLTGELSGEWERVDLGKYKRG